MYAVIVARSIRSADGVHSSWGAAAVVTAESIVPGRMLGAASERQHSHPPATAEALADIVLPDHEGNEVRLGDLWSERPAALVWLRHYG